MPRSVRLATLCAFFFHGIFIVMARYRMSYDAYVHMFFADHYQKDWWSLWDTRWYAGFAVTSYPPLVHQMMALLSNVVGLDKAFAIILWIIVTLLPLSVYAFARIFVGRTSAGYAALGTAFLPSVYLTAHIFGQLPFMFGTVLALFGAASLVNYLKEGGIHNFALTVALTTTTMAAHHAVLLIQPFLVLAISARLFFSQETDRKQLIVRLILFGTIAILFSLAVIFPFWEWGRTQSMQTPIDHASRHNYFQDPLAPVLFFLPMYGPLMLFIPSALSLTRKPKLIGLGISLFILFLLGLGGTTPLPRLFFGQGWEWLTYDRFAFWASLFLLPFFGMIVILLRRHRSKQIRLKIFASLAVFSLIVGSVTMFLPLQPGAVCMSPVVNFLKQDDRSTWRYLTFGFGDQMARLSTLTTATTIDGSYHTARTLPELRTSGIGQIDTAFWLPDGFTKLGPILQQAGTRGVRWGFVNIPQYVPILEKNGWVKLTTLKGGVQVWENPKAVLPEPSKIPPVDLFASFAWGTFPLLSLITTLSLASLRLYPIQAEKFLRGVHTFIVSLIPLALCFWYYRTIGSFFHPRVYFTYDNALFFLSDALALIAVTLWIAVKISQLPVTNYGLRNYFSGFIFLLFTLSSLSTLSIVWSPDWRTSLSISLHLWLVFLVVLSLRDWKEAWRPLMFGLCAALAIQIIIGFTIFSLQSTAFLQTLGLTWPGLLSASTPGASVVQLQNGLRILRAYGTFPHPNILGGFLIMSLLGPVYLFFANEKPNYAALLLLVLGIILLGLTFSRSAWLGSVAFLAVLLLKSKYLDRKRLWLLFTACIVSMILTLLPLRSFLFSRIADASIHTEQISTVGRSWLAHQAFSIFRQHSLLGVGIGSFILELSKRAAEGAPIEPVHNMFLLIGSELGITGLLLLAGLIITIIIQTKKLRTPQAIFASGALTGLGVISLFDHYLWSIAPGRMMLGLALGLWAGQVSCDDA